MGEKSCRECEHAGNIAYCIRCTDSIGWYVWESIDELAHDANQVRTSCYFEEHGVDGPESLKPLTELRKAVFD